MVIDLQLNTRRSEASDITFLLVVFAIVGGGDVGVNEIR